MQECTKEDHSSLPSLSTQTTLTIRQRLNASPKYVPPFSSLPSLPALIPPRSTHEKADANRQIYHPNLDLEGNVCLNILREDWKPVLNLNAVMVGLQYLFLEPNPDDPLNKGTFSSRTKRRRADVVR